MTHPYLPDIIEGIVTRINTAFSTRSVDPFNVVYGKGIYAQVGRDLFNAPDKSNIIWLVMPFDEDCGRDPMFYSSAVFSIIIASATDPKYSQQQRDDNTIKPRLIPMYDMMLEELKREGWLQCTRTGTPEHKKVIRPYWGSGATNAPGSMNLFEQYYVDALAMYNIKMNVNEDSSCGSDYAPLSVDNYPAAVSSLNFFEDIELIVDGGNEWDPVSGQSTVIIPALEGLDYDVMQRGFGQLLYQRSPEIIKDDAGGFSLTGDLKFSQGNVYIIKIKPTFFMPPSVTGLITKKLGLVSIQRN